MNCKRFEELAAGHALGALGHEEAAQLQLLIAHDADARKEVAAFIDAAAAIATAALPRVVPSEDLRARILAKVATTPQVRPAPVHAPTTEGYRFLLNSPEGWKDTGASGVRT
jgi:anti-sigma-K factor RskA